MLISILVGIIIAIILGLRFSRPISRLVVATKKLLLATINIKSTLKEMMS